jgi:Fe2+ transport system protein FeoA
MSLAEVNAGGEVVIGALRCSSDSADRLREIGLHPGVSVRVLQRSVFGAIIVAVGFSTVALDRETARSVAVEEVRRDVSRV